MTLKNSASPHLAGGPMTLKNRWSHEGAQIALQVVP
jgi:hypothetical protein